MRFRRVTIGLILLICLSGCGNNGQPGGQVEQNGPPAATATTQATAVGKAATEASTPTAGAEPTAIPTAPAATAAASATALPTITPPGGVAGTIYVLRNGTLVAYDVGEEQERPTGVSGTGFFRLSPDGRLVALAQARDSTSKGSLLIMSVDGTQSFQVAEDGATNDFAWAPDSSAIAYVIGGQGEALYPTHCSRGSQVWVFELASGDQRKVGDGCNPAWSPESKRIAYVTPAGIVDDPQNELFLVNRLGQNSWAPLKGEILDEIFSMPRNAYHRPFWSADGKHILVFARVSEFAETSWDTIEMVDATTGATRPVAVVADVTAPSVRVAPDQRWIVYSAVSAKGTSSIVVHQVLGQEHDWQVPWEPERSVKLTDSKGPSIEYAQLADWSPDGAQLAIVYCRPQSGEMGLCTEGMTGELRLMDPLTGETSEPLLEGIDVQAGIDWSP